MIAPIERSVGRLTGQCRRWITFFTPGPRIPVKIDGEPLSEELQKVIMGEEHMAERMPSKKVLVRADQPTRWKLSDVNKFFKGAVGAFAFSRVFFERGFYAKVNSSVRNLYVVT